MLDGVECFDPFRPGSVSDPMRALGQIRRGSEACRGTDARVLVVGHEACRMVLRDHTSFSSRGGMHQAVDHAEDRRSLNELDPPEHTELRKLFSRVVGPPAVRRLAPIIRRQARELLDRLPEHGEFDLMSALAIPLPARVAAKLIGAPAADAHSLQGWAAAVTARLPNLPSRDPDLVALNGYLARLIDRRRTMAGQWPADVLTELLSARTHGRGLSDRAIGTQLGFLVAASTETTTSLVGNCVVRLLEGGLWERVVRDRRLVRAALEESLRLDAPVQVFMRTSTKALDLHGCPVEPGDRIQVHVGSAGRDERKWARPEDFDLERHRPAHLSFGTGIHYCAGADLARFEARIVLEGLLDRYPRLRLVEAGVRRKVAARHLHGPQRVELVALRPPSVAMR